MSSSQAGMVLEFVAGEAGQNPSTANGIIERNSNTGYLTKEVSALPDFPIKLRLEPLE